MSKLPKELEVFAQMGIKLVHISTDHLFMGIMHLVMNKLHYLPSIFTEKQREKEKSNSENNSDALVIRTNFFGWGATYKASFSDKILKSLERGKPINLFDDVYYTPISVKTLTQNSSFS